MSYRPITDVAILARSKVKYYGAFPNGFLHRARQLLGARSTEPVLFVCAVQVRKYPSRGFYPKVDRTLDLDPKCRPDFLQDARHTLPLCGPHHVDLWRAVLIDRPYTKEDAAHYRPGAAALPELGDLLKRALAIVPVGGMVGTFDYLWPAPPKNATESAVLAVGTGRNGRARWFCVFERIK